MALGGRVRGRACAVAVFLAALLAGGVPCAGAAPALTDAQLVYCLAQQHRTELVGAAGALGLVTADSRPEHVVRAAGGRARRLSAWAKERPTDFERACKALVDASALDQAGPADSGKPPFLEWFLPLLVGAGLTWAATEYRSARDHSRSAANEIRAASGTFRAAVGDYVRAWVGTTVGAAPSMATLDQARRNLAASLARATGHRKRWTFARDVLDDLHGPRYRVELAGAWLGKNEQVKQAHAEHIESLLRAFDADTELIASAVQSLSPVKRRRMRTRTPASVGVSLT